jgi:hypothetical protein
LRKISNYFVYQWKSQRIILVKWIYNIEFSSLYHTRKYIQLSDAVLLQILGLREAKKILERIESTACWSFYWIFGLFVDDHLKIKIRKFCSPISIIILWYLDKINVPFLRHQVFTWPWFSWQAT